MKLLVAAAVVLCVSQCQALDERRFLSWPLPDPWPPRGRRVSPNTLNDGSIYQTADMLISAIKMLQNLQKLFDQHGWTELSTYVGHCIDILNQSLKYQISSGGNYKRARYAVMDPPCEILDIRPECIAGASA